MSAARGRPAAVGLLTGYAIMVFGVVGLVRAVPLRSVGQVAAWVVGADLLHDFLVAPVVCVAGFALARALPSPLRWPVRAGALGTAFVMVVAYPALRGFGRATAPGNDSVLPLDYTTAVLTVLAVVWGVALVWGLTNVVTRREH
jgi:hypothetical protein